MNDFTDTLEDVIKAKAVKRHPNLRIKGCRLSMWDSEPDWLIYARGSLGEKYKTRAVLFQRIFTSATDKFVSDGHGTLWNGEFIGEALNVSPVITPGAFHDINEWLKWGTPLAKYKSIPVGAVVCASVNSVTHLGFAVGLLQDEGILLMECINGFVTINAIQMKHVTRVAYPEGIDYGSIPTLPIFKHRAASFFVWNYHAYYTN